MGDGIIILIFCKESLIVMGLSDGIERNLKN